MDEYIIWSDELKQFGDNITLKELLKDVCETWDVYEVEEGKYFRNIGLKDINGKSIYADSSIVEFCYMLPNTNTTTAYGYFSYNNFYLCYMFHFFILGDNIQRISREIHLGKQFKIIDTIQENKLGLIK